MPGEGFIFDMLATLRNNSRLSKGNRALRISGSFFERKRAYEKYAPPGIELKKATPEQLAKIKLKIVKERKKRDLRIALAFSFLVFLLAVLTVFLLKSIPF